MKAETKERLLPWGAALLAAVSLPLLYAAGLRPEVRATLPSSIDVVATLIGFLAALRALIKLNAFARQSGLTRRLNAAFFAALRFAFVSLAFSVVRQLLVEPQAGAPLSPLMIAVTAGWAAMLAATCVSAYLAFSAAFALLAHDEGT